MTIAAARTCFAPIAKIGAVRYCRPMDVNVESSGWLNRRSVQIVLLMLLVVSPVGAPVIAWSILAVCAPDWEAPITCLPQPILDYVLPFAFLPWVWLGPFLGFVWLAISITAVTLVVILVARSVLNRR